MTNSGSGAVSLTTPTIAGTDSTQFLVAQNSCGTSLPAGASCTVSVSFNPTTTGSKTATLSVGDAAASLSGAALVGALTFTPNPGNFPTTLVNGNSTVKFTLTNSSTVGVPHNGFSITGSSEFSFASLGGIPDTLAPNTSYLVFVVFRPTSVGTKTATLSIGAGASVSLSGTAPLTAIYRINAGSSTAVSPFAGDQYASGGRQHSVTNTIDVSGVTNPAPAAVYQSERYGNMTYTFPGLTPSTAHTVRLHFAEIYQTSVGRRVFNVAINGTTVLSNFDIYKSVGAQYKA